MKTRGVIDPLTLCLVAGVAAFALGGVKLPTWFDKKPPTTQLTQAQIDLNNARAAQLAAETKLAQLEAERKVVGEMQLDYAQQMAAGTVLALGRVAPDQVTPEVKLASEFANRTEAGLAAYRGDLTPQARAEMERMVAQALSAVQAERDAMRVALAQKDAALAQTINDKASLAAQIPTLQASVDAAKAQVAAKDAKAQELVKEVSVWAEAKAASDAKAGSLDALSGRLMRGLIGLAALYLFIHFMLPSLAQEFPASRILTWADKTAKSLTSARM